jgi:hypothetical protein
MLYLVNHRQHTRAIIEIDATGDEAKAIAINAIVFGTQDVRADVKSISIINEDAKAVPYVEPVGAAKPKQDWRAADDKRRRARWATGVVSDGAIYRSVDAHHVNAWLRLGWMVLLPSKSHPVADAYARVPLVWICQECDPPMPGE